MSRESRIRISAPIQLPDREPDHVQVGVTHDLGRGGLGFLSPTAFDRGEKIPVTIMIPGRRGVELRAEIMWCEDRSDAIRLNHRCGARFLAMGVRESLFLQEYLSVREVSASETAATP